MSRRLAIKQAFERTVNALKRRPSLAQYSAVTRIRVENGTTCHIEHGDWNFIVDVGTQQGGNNAGPGPGILERAALGSCMAIGYASWAAYMDVPIDAIRLEVETDVDVTGMYGLSDTAPGFKEIRYRVAIESPATQEQVMQVIETADKHSPVLDDFSRAIPVKRFVKIYQGG